MAPSVSPASTHYALVVDAGSSGSRLQIYSWRDPDLERAEILQEVRQARDAGESSSSKKKWWWKASDALLGKGKGKAQDQMERRALRRLVRVGKGVEGDAWVKRVEPGISTISPDDIPAYLAPLLTHALQQIPPSQHSSTPIYVLATAGMRLLTDEARDSILKATCNTLHSEYPFSLDGPSCQENVRVISGEEEGMWGWVAVNYLMDGFGHAPESPSSGSIGDGTSTGLLPLAPLAEPPPDSSKDSVTPVDVNHHSPTFGFLDMGGASTQLAFSPTLAEMAKSGFSKDDLRSVSLKLLSGEEVSWPLFVASWLGFGTNKVRDRYVERLIQDWRKSSPDSVKDISTPVPDPCLPQGLTHPSTDATTQPGLIGTGSFPACLERLKPLLDGHSACPTEHCLFGGVPTPRIDFDRDDQRGFIGISEYWYTAQQVLGLGGVWDWGEWEKGMGEFCARDWKKIEQQVEQDKGWHGAEVELSRLQMQCFKGAWISNVLHEGIGIPRLVDHGGNDTLTGGDVGDTNEEAERRAREKGLLESHRKGKHHFQSMDEVGETAISWTLGKMVIEASKAVHPRSPALEAAWTSRLPSLGLGHVEQRLNALGIQTVWAYAFMTFILVVCIFNSLKRRFRWTWSFFPGGSSSRRRKPSISGAAPVQPASSRRWPWSSSSRYDTPDAGGYAFLEDGTSSSDTTPTKPLAGRATIGRMRLWSLKIGNILKRSTPVSFGLHPEAARHKPPARHVSMPLAPTNYAHSNGWSSSQPPSPRANGSGFFFTPALSVQPSSTSVSPMLPQSTGPIPIGSSSSISASPSPSNTASPPRMKAGRPTRPRQSSFNTSSEPGSTGWNDPPLTLLTHNLGRGPNSSLESAAGESEPSGTLTPTARPGYDRAISRQSSRVNLSELGLAQRNMSRSATPHEFDDNIS